MKAIAGARLADYTTFGLGGPCRLLLDCSDPDALAEAVCRARGAGTPYVLMGEGSNLLVSDHGYDGVVIRYARDDSVVQCSDEVLDVSGASRLDAVARAAAECGLEGLTCCTGIPGTVGGAVAGNAGAWGRQIADSLLEVTVLNTDGNDELVQASDAGFAYRQSRFQRDGGIVVSARVALTPAPASELLAERERVLALRATKHPDLSRVPSAGSFFRNIEPTSAAGRRQAAGWFLEQAGALELREGRAAVFEKHANIVVAGEGCTAQQVRDLAGRMAAAVRKQFGFDLVREVRYLGRFDGESDHSGFF